MENIISFIEGYGSLEYLLALIFAIGLFIFLIIGIKPPKIKPVVDSKAVLDEDNLIKIEQIVGLNLSDKESYENVKSKMHHYSTANSSILLSMVLDMMSKDLKEKSISLKKESSPEKEPS